MVKGWIWECRNHGYLSINRRVYPIFTRCITTSSSTEASNTIDLISGLNIDIELVIVMYFKLLIPNQFDLIFLTLSYLPTHITYSNTQGGDIISQANLENHIYPYP